MGIKHKAQGISECQKKAFGQPVAFRLTSNVVVLVGPSMGCLDYQTMKQPMNSRAPSAAAPASITGLA